MIERIQSLTARLLVVDLTEVTVTADRYGRSYQVRVHAGALRDPRRMEALCEALEAATRPDVVVLLDDGFAEALDADAAASAEATAALLPAWAATPYREAALAVWAGYKALHLAHARMARIESAHGFESAYLATRHEALAAQAVIDRNEYLRHFFLRFLPPPPPLRFVIPAPGAPCASST